MWNLDLANLFLVEKLTGLHVFELVDAALGVALTYFAKSLVLVSSLAHVFSVDLVHGGFFSFVSRLGQILLQGLQTKTRSTWGPFDRTCS
jgi:hypothetical protein